MTDCELGKPDPVRTPQVAVHPRLERVVRRHLESPWLGGRHRPTRESFERIAPWIESASRQGLIFDSGCGTGLSTRALAERFPDRCVLGIDRSAVRLARTGAPSLPAREGNVIWLRAELSAFWRLAREAGWRVHRHYLLYPNPWPKASHLRRRWHAHPVWPDLLALGGLIELRTNWKTYADEFALAAGIALGQVPAVGPVDPEDIPSAFQRKYAARGQALWRVTVSTGSVG